LSAEGARGMLPPTSRFSRFPLWGDLGKSEPVREHRQCLLFLSIILDNRSYPDFLIIPTISGKADNYGLLLKKGQDNFFIKGRYPTARMQIPLRKKS
jgi:hypothetical protein